MDVLVCFRVYDQHKLSKEQWEDRIKSWWTEHKGMMRSVSFFFFFFLNIYAR
jgi:hypothetical protein